jgi:purine-cytosine permease-like protein
MSITTEERTDSREKPETATGIGASRETGSGSSEWGVHKEHSFLFTRDKKLRKEATEDYAIRKVPAHWKRRPMTYATIMFGSVTSVFAFALGGQIAVVWGMPTLLIALAVGFVIGAPLAGVIAWQTANSSIDTDLLARGAGFGFLGSTFTTLVYGLNWIMYAGFETVFLGAAVHVEAPSIPMWLLYLLAAMVIVPLNWYGISQIHFFAKWSAPLFIAGAIWLFVVTMRKHGPAIDFPPMSAATLLPAIGIVLANIGIWVLLVGDSARFARKRDRGKMVSISIIVGFGGVFLVLPPLGGLMALHSGSANPGTYASATLGIWGLLWILVTQIRVQECNYYSGSLSFTNVVARLFHWLPGRGFFVFMTGVLAFVLAELKIVDHLSQVLTFMSVFLFATIGTVIYSLIIQQRELLKLGQVWVEHRRGYLRNWGVPATTGLVVGSVVGGALSLWDIPSPYGGLVGIVVGGLGAPLVATLVTLAMPKNPHYLIARMPPEDWRDTNLSSEEDLTAAVLQTKCGKCGVSVMKSDAVECPVTDSGVLCSACCSAHATCHDVCKTKASLATA